MWELFLRSAQSVQQQYGVGGAARPVAKLLAQSSCSRRGGPPAVVPAVTGPLRSSSSSREKGTMRRSALLRAGKCTQNTACMPRARFHEFRCADKLMVPQQVHKPAQQASLPRLRKIKVAPRSGPSPSGPSPSTARACASASSARPRTPCRRSAQPLAGCSPPATPTDGFPRGWGRPSPARQVSHPARQTPVRPLRAPAGPRAKPPPPCIERPPRGARSGPTGAAIPRDQLRQAPGQRNKQGQEVPEPKGSTARQPPRAAAALARSRPAPRAPAAAVRRGGGVGAGAQAGAQEEGAGGGPHWPAVQCHPGPQEGG